MRLLGANNRRELPLEIKKSLSAGAGHAGFVLRHASLSFQPRRQFPIIHKTPKDR
jgi:hypothetical protein